MHAEVGDELLRELATRIELRKILHNAAPHDLPTALDLWQGWRRWGRRRIMCWVEIQRVLEGGERLWHVSTQPLEPLLHRRRLFHPKCSSKTTGDSRRWSFRLVLCSHQHLLYHILVYAGSVGHALQRRNHALGQMYAIQMLVFARLKTRAKTFAQISLIVSIIIFSFWEENVKEQWNRKWRWFVCSKGEMSLPLRYYGYK